MKRARASSKADPVVVPPSKKFAPKHRACAAGDEQGLTETCSGCGRILQKCRDCQRILWPHTEREFIYEDERFVENLLATCGFKYKVRNVDIDWVKKTVEDHKKKTSFHLRPHLVREDCDRCKKTHKACSLCGQIFFAEEQTPRYSGIALLRVHGISARLRQGGRRTSELGCVYARRPAEGVPHHVPKHGR